MLLLTIHLNNKCLGHPTHGEDPQPLQRVCPALWKADAGLSRPAGQHLQNCSPCWSSRGAGGPSPKPGLTPNLQLSAPAQNPVVFHPWRPWQRRRGKRTHTIDLRRLFQCSFWLHPFRPVMTKKTDKWETTVACSQWTTWKYFIYWVDWGDILFRYTYSWCLEGEFGWWLL